MSKKHYYYIASLAFFFIGIGHLARVFYGWSANIGGVEIPLWVSWAAIIIAGYLAVRGWMFAKRSR